MPNEDSALAKWLSLADGIEDVTHRAKLALTVRAADVAVRNRAGLGAALRNALRRVHPCLDKNEAGVTLVARLLVALFAIVWAMEAASR